MQHNLLILLLTLFHFIALLPSSASVPLRWTVETSRVQPAVFDVVRGETVDFEAALQSNGKPLEMAGKTVSIFWQTNGMANAWWSAPAQVQRGRDIPVACEDGNTTASVSNVLSATFTPAMDPGASSVTGFIGSTGEIYRAAFQLRFRHGPGAVPNVIEQPPPVLDLAHTVVINPPWPTDQTIDARIRQVIADDDITANVPTGMVRTVVSNTVTKAYVESLGISGGGSSIDTNAVIDIAQSVSSSKLDGPTDSTLTLSGKAADAKATGDALANKLSTSGGTMRGDINMDYYDIIDVSNLSAYGLTVYESAAFEADASVSGDLSVGNILSVDNTIDLNGTGDIINANSVTANNVAADDVIYYGNRSLMSLDAQVAGKINRVLDATTGNLAVFSSSGNLSDSRISSSVITNHSAQLSSLSTQVSSLSSSKANLTGGNIFYGDQWVANGDLNLAGAGLYMDRSGTGQEYIYGKWTGDMFAFEGTSPLLFLNEVYFSTAYGNRPKIDDSPIATEDDVEPIRTAANDALSYGRGIFMYMNGTTNCYFSGTNYVIGAESTNRTAFALEDGMDLATVPCSMALWEIRDGTRQCVWDQRDWTVWYWNFKLAQYRDEHDGRDAALRELIAGRCPLNWASYTACGLTNAAGDTTWIDTPKVVLSAGFAWQHQLTAEGVGYWGIQGNGYEVGGSGTNSTLRITDWEGNEVLKITKGSARLAYLTGGSGAASGWDGGWMWYDMQCDAQPTGEFTVDLLDTFVEEGDGCPAEVREYVDRGNGVWRCYFRARPGINATACFARFKVQVGTETTVEYGTAPTVPGLIVNGRKIAPVIPSNAHVGDTITWKVVQ